MTENLQHHFDSRRQEHYSEWGVVDRLHCSCSSAALITKDEDGEEVDAHLVVHISLVQQQNGLTDCGVFAIACIVLYYEQVVTNTCNFYGRCQCLRMCRVHRLSV